MRTGWRVVNRRWATEAFSGEGARLNGGRWNRSGTRAVYLASSVSLATLEILVHLQNSQTLDGYVFFSAAFGETLVERLDRSLLPANRREYPAPSRLQEIGEEWLASRRSVVLEVPGAVVESESNYLLNPAHPDYPALQIEGPFPYPIDARLTGQQ